LTLALLASVALAGCSNGRQTPTLLTVAIGIDTDQRVDTEQRQNFKERIETLLTEFRQLYPNTRVDVGLYAEETLISAIQRRSRSGLQPDLLLVSGYTAQKLLEDGLVDPYPANPALLRNFEPATLNRVRNAKEQLAGLPVLLQTEISCFDRRRMPRPPRNLEALAAASASGQTVGLTVEPSNLFWTAGSLGAVPALTQIVTGQTLGAAERSALVGWLRWLQQASGQQDINFFPNQMAADNEFRAGRLSWIPCRSINVPPLRKKFGNNLGIAPLPNGANGFIASPINKVRVLALGRRSSAIGRQRALSFVQFVVNPLSQRTLTMGSQTVLPVNRFVTVPVKSSQVLETMVTAAQQGHQADELAARLNRGDQSRARIQTLLTELVFGETNPEVAADQLVRLLEPRR
jgi:ABC-type glycerol-3-phosphate transport system substrate-binding protein